MYFVKTPYLLKFLFPFLLWSKSKKEKLLYLTFDDGPIPEVTIWVLDILAKYNIKATFFCVGDNVNKFTEIFNRIISEGHTVGNHTYNHLKGWSINNDIYIDNIIKCNEVVKSSLFRPPHGQVSLKQIWLLKKQYKIVMWDVLTGDFDSKLTPKKCLLNTIKHTENGSIIVFHDSIKAKENLYYVLPRALEHWVSMWYSFGILK
jgi:peptidoglycan/xylan/chitin deacetylase (PgdA/CDA1 family)